ncbi:MAG TPA: anthranilate synthase component I family protein [Candidatus Saccharimonadales bacterium]|nr:anthranilate synthase component I family protein [Candidatus Saccharimonadales bacterium]
MIDLSFLKAKPKKVRLPLNADYLRLYYALKYSFDKTYMFESLVSPKQQDRYFTIGFDPLYVFSARGRKLRIEGQEKTEEIKTGNPYEKLKSFLPKIPASNKYQGGLIGYFSYEAANYFEPALNLDEHPGFPVFELGLYVDGLIYDRETDELTYYTYHEDRSSTVENIIGQLDGLDLPRHVESVESGEYSIDKPEYLRVVERTLEEIKKGNSFQVEVGFKKDYRIKGDKFAIYNRLREVNPSPYMYYVHFGQREVFGSSPELVVSATGGRILTTPTAGTVRRGKSEQEDKELARQLLNDPKERAEHAMLVDLHRNDISIVSKYGSVKVEELMHLIKFKYVQHIYSDIVGELRPDKDSFDLLAGIMPCGVVTGAPKIETMKIIARNEKIPRGPYGGAVGRFSFNGDCAFAMPIRSLFCNGDDCYTQACGGVVFDSIPEKEYDEVIAKLAGMEKTIKDVSND